MTLSEYLIEAVAKRTTGKYKTIELSKDLSFLKFVSAVEQIYDCVSFWGMSNIGPKVNSLPDEREIAKETADIINRNGAASIRLYAGIPQGSAMYIFDPQKKEGFYLGFFNNNKLSTIEMYRQNKSSSGIVMTGDNRFAKLKDLDSQFDFFEQWLYGTPF